MSSIQEQILLTKEGFKKLQEELKKREGEIRKKLQETLNQMRSQGDLKENDGYSMAVEEFQNNEEKILEIKHRLEKAEIVTKSKSNIVEVGSIVTIKDGEGKEKKYTIVGIEEGNPLEMKISYDSPIGKALMGKKKNSKVSISLPAGDVSYTIANIE